MAGVEKDYCFNGHAMTEDNIYYLNVNHKRRWVLKDGTVRSSVGQSRIRRCKTCTLARMQRSHNKNPLRETAIREAARRRARMRKVEARVAAYKAKKEQNG